MDDFNLQTFSGLSYLLFQEGTRRPKRILSLVTSRPRRILSRSFLVQCLQSSEWLQVRFLNTLAHPWYFKVKWQIFEQLGSSWREIKFIQWNSFSSFSEACCVCGEKDLLGGGIYTGICILSGHQYMSVNYHASTLFLFPFFIVVQLQLSQFFPYCSPLPAHPLLPQSVATLLSITMDPSHMFLD